MNIVFRILAILLILFIIVVIAEFFIRAFIPRHLYEFRDATTDWQLDQNLGWVQKSNLDVIFRGTSGQKLIRFQTNEDGLTPASVKQTKNPNVIRIILFGDSTVVGKGVDQENTVNMYLGHMLNASGIPAEVSNAGVQGYSTDQVLLRMKQIVPLYKPDIIAYCVCDNDFGGNVSRKAYGLPKPMFILERDKTLKELPPKTKGIKIPMFGSGPRKWIQFSALYRYFYPHILRFRSIVFNWETRNLLGLEPAKKYYNPDVLEEIDWVLFIALLREMKKVADENGAKFFFYVHPSIAEVWDVYIDDVKQRYKIASKEYNRYVLEQRMRKIADDNSLYYGPLIDYFLIQQKRGPFHLLPRNPHCNEVGYKVTAEALAQFLLESGILK